MYSTTYRDLQAILDLQDLLEHQVVMDPMVKMENLVMVVNQEQRDLQDILESASIFQVLLVDPEKKETKENQESLVLLAIMAIPEPLDLTENLANMHHLVSQVFLVNREGPVKMAVQDNQEYLVEKDRKAELLDWKNFKTKSLMASNHFEQNCKNVVTKLSTQIMLAIINDIRLMIQLMIHLMIQLMILSHVHHMERSVLNAHLNFKMNHLYVISYRLSRVLVVMLAPQDHL